MVFRRPPRPRAFVASSPLGHASLVAALAMGVAGAGRAAAAPDDAILEPGIQLERSLGPGELHGFLVMTAGGQYLEIVVDQRGVDVVATLAGPGGERLLEVNNPNGSSGPEPVVWVTAAPGAYRLELRPNEGVDRSGAYSVRLAALRAATPADTRRVEARRAFERAQRLLLEGSAESLQKAATAYDEALALARAAADRATEGRILNDLGVTSHFLGYRAKALEYYEAALPVWRAVGDRAGEGETLGNIGALLDVTGEKQKALDYYARALAISRAVDDRAGVATNLSNMGLIYYQLGESQRALDAYNEALPLRREVADRAGEAATVLNIGAAHNALGRNQEALDFFMRALPIFRAIPDLKGEATTLSNIGLTYHLMGDGQKALDFLAQALERRRAAGDRRGEASTLSNIGSVYTRLGDYSRALEYYGRALPLRVALSDPAGEAATLANMGTVYGALGQPRAALDHFTRALARRRALNDPRGEAAALAQIGALYTATGEHAKALESLRAALALQQGVGDRGGEAATLAHLGDAYLASGKVAEAVEHYTRALPLAEEVDDPRGQAAIRYGIARARRAEGNFPEARAQVEAARSIVESLRTSVVSQDLRATYFASVRDYYELHVDLLMEMHRRDPAGGFDAAAFGASETARAKGLLELLAEAGADIRQGVEPKLVERERELERRLSARATYLSDLLTRRPTAGQVAAARKAIDDTIGELEAVGTEIRRASPRYAALEYPEPLDANAIRRQVLDPETLLLEYALGTERSYLFVLDTSGLVTFDLPGRATIDAAARRAYDLLTERGRGGAAAADAARLGRLDAEFAGAAASLSDMLLGPAAGRLGSKRLAIVAEGAVQLVPFAALPRPAAGTAPSAADRRPLVSNHEIVYLPSASALAVLRRERAGRRPAPKALAVLADPVFGAEDARVRPVARRPSPEAGAARPRIPRLLHTKGEAERILALVPPGEAKAALGFAANREVATSPELGRYRIVHFATHGIVDTERPELSGLMLSSVDGRGTPVDGFLRAFEVYNLNLPVELVVLSGCETGLGKDVRGEGFVGLTRGFMYAGASRVVVSLWRVSDSATEELMARFYRLMLRDGLSAASALRAAQSSMWEEDKRRSPYFWAAFTLHGEWR